MVRNTLAWECMEVTMDGRSRYRLKQGIEFFFIYGKMDEEPWLIIRSHVIWIIHQTAVSICKFNSLLKRG